MTFVLHTKTDYNRFLIKKGEVVKTSFQVFSVNSEIIISRDQAKKCRHIYYWQGGACKDQMFRALLPVTELSHFAC